MLEVISEQTIVDSDVVRLTECEAVIERGLKTFVDVGNALLEIRDSRLYREQYSTFKDYCQKRWQFTKQRAYQLMDAAGAVSNIEKSKIFDFLPVRESHAAPLAELSAEQQAEAWKLAVETAPDGKITAAHVQSVVDEIQQKPHVAHNSGNNEWYTPPEYIEAAVNVMGGIDLDPASSEKANQIVGATVYFTAWFTELAAVASAAVFPRGRVRFLDPDGNPGAPLQGQAVIYLGNKTDEFLTEFSKFGWGARLWLQH